MGKKDDDGDKARNKPGGEAFAESVRDSAQQIWLAGLGAFAKAQQEGGKIFESLVKDGMSMQRKTQAAAGEKFSDATSRMASAASELQARASGQWDKLEGIFEDRVARAMDRLDTPTRADIDALNDRIDALERKLSRPAVRPASAKAAAPGTRSAGRGTTRKAE